MKNYFYNLLIACLITSTIYAQQVNNTEFKTKTTQVFQNLDKTRVPHGILLDFGMEFTNLQAFNGTLTDSTFTTSQRLSDTYKTLLMCRVRENVTTGFITPQEYATRWYQQRTAGVITLSGQYFKYNLFADDAYPNKLNYTNNQFSDKFVGSVWQNPYEEKQLFIMAPAVTTYKGLSFELKLPSNLFLSNYPSLVQSIEIDVADGLGFRTITQNQLLSVSYTQANTYTWKYKITLTNGTILLSHSKMVIEGGLITYPYVVNQTTTQVTQATPDLSGYAKTTITATTPYGTNPLFQYGSATVYIRYRAGGNNIVKPLIVAEGFDDGVILKPEQEAGSNNIRDFLSSVTDGGLLFGETNQYDIIYVDWNNGVDFIQKNAYVLEEVIKWVNAQKAANGSTIQNVVIGQSMGGLVARYALRDIELNRNFNHDTRLYVSHDAPHLGANVPLSVQYSARHLRNLYVNAPIPLLLGEILLPLVQDFAQGFSQIINAFGANTSSNSDLANQITPLQAFSLADVAAARQMQYNWVNKNYGINNVIHDAWQQELSNLGYPIGYPLQSKPIRNVAIANGSECGVTQVDTGNIMSYIKDAGRDTLLSNYIGILDVFYGAIINNPLVILVALFPGKSYWQINFQSKYMTTLNENKSIYRGLIRYKKKIFWFIPVTITITDLNVTQPPAYLPYDIYGGGQQRTNPNQLPLSSIISNTFGFIPTASALDIGHGTTLINDTDYRNSYVGALPPALPKNSPFQNFTTHFDVNNPNNNNSTHISFNTRNGNWLRAELNTAIADEYTNCSYICASNKIVGAETICTTENYSLPTGATTYNWTITEGADLVTLSGNGSPNITLTSSGNGTGYITMQVICGDMRCGYKTLTKKVYTGLPAFNKFTYGCANRSLCFTAYANYSFTSPTILNTKNKVIANFFGLTATEAANSANWQWQEALGNNLLFINNASSKNSLDLCPIAAGTTTLQVKAKNACGWSEWVDIPITIVELPSVINRQSQISLKADTSNSQENTNNDTPYSWASENIWIRNAQDGIIEHQNPEFSTTVPNYIYVRVTNSGCTTSPGGFHLKTYWAKASTSLNWPESWNDATYNNTNTKLGNLISTVAIPELQPDEETILSMPFIIPDSGQYNDIFPEPWHFGFLARAVSESDETTSPETQDLVQNVIDNDNIAYKNVTIVDCASDVPNTETIGGVIAVGNTFNTTKSFYLELVKEDLETGKPIYDEAEVSLKLDEVLYQSWVRGGKTALRLENTLDEKIMLVKGNNVFLKDLELNPNETGTLYLKFNFLTQEMTDKSKYVYHVIQKETGTNKIIGGETYVIKKQSRPLFVADAGDTKYVDKNEPITISASQINEQAVYNWYDTEGNLVFTGKDFSISTDVSQKFKLEIIATDGFKDYTEVEVKLNPNTLGIISPNPAINTVNIAYKLNEVSSAYLMIVGGYGTTGTSNNYILDINSSETNIDLSNYSNGLYTIALICNGQIVDAKTLVKQ